MEAVQQQATPSDEFSVSREFQDEEDGIPDTQMVTVMSMGERLYTGNGSRVMTHSILRKRSTTRTAGREESPSRNISPVRHAGAFRGSRRRLQSSPSSLSSSSSYTPDELRSTSFSSGISKSSPHIPSSSSSQLPTRHLPPTPNKRLELALDKFSNIALPFYLQIIACHTSNISQVRSVPSSSNIISSYILQLVLGSNQSEISSELERASRSVRKLGSLLFEMEVLRSFLETESEIRYFDKRVMPCKIRAYVAIQKLKGDYFSHSFDT